jgi:hypothetical protein
MVAFFIGPDDQLKRGARADAVVVHRADGFDCAQAADHAVEIAAVGDRINVRAEKQRGQPGLGAFAAGEDVAGGVDTHGQAGFSQQPGDIFARGQVFFRKTQAGHAGFEALPFRPAEFGEFFERAPQPLLVDAERLLRRRRAGQREQHEHHQASNSRPHLHRRHSTPHSPPAAGAGRSPGPQGTTARPMVCVSVPNQMVFVGR